MRRTTFGSRGNWRRLLSSPDSSKLPWSSYGLVRSDEESTQRQEPVHGDLDVVIGLVKQHRTLTRISPAGQSRLNRLSRLLRRLGTAKKRMLSLSRQRKKKPKPSGISRRKPSTWRVWRARNNRTHIFSHNRTHVISHSNRKTQGERILPNWEQKKTNSVTCCHSGLKWD